MITNKPKSRETNLAIQELENEILIYDTLINKAICLNSTSALVWQACDGKRDVPEISRYLSKKHKQKLTEDLVWFTLDILKKSNLIANNDEITSVYEGMSRREIIRRVGIASVVALPVISSIIAPTSSRAASNVICGVLGETPCVTVADCDVAGGETSCTDNCCRFGEAIDGGICVSSPTRICPPAPSCGFFC